MNDTFKEIQLIEPTNLGHQSLNCQNLSREQLNSVSVTGDRLVMGGFAKRLTGTGGGGEAAPRWRSGGAAEPSRRRRVRDRPPAGAAGVAGSAAGRPDAATGSLHTAVGPIHSHHAR